MGIVVNTNSTAMFSNLYLGRANEAVKESMQKLSSGFRINSAKDDAAGLGISNQLTALTRGLGVAIRNGNDALSIAQVAEGAMVEQTQMLLRMRDLALQAANGSNGEDQRRALDSEMQQLQTEITRIADTTTFGTEKLLNGFFEKKAFQVGPNAWEHLYVDIDNTSSSGMGFKYFKSDQDEISVIGSNEVSEIGGIKNTRSLDVTVNDNTYKIDLEYSMTAQELEDKINSIKGISDIQVDLLDGTGTLRALEGNEIEGIKRYKDNALNVAYGGTAILTEKDSMSFTFSVYNEVTNADDKFKFNVDLEGVSDASSLAHAMATAINTENSKDFGPATNDRLLRGLKAEVDGDALVYSFQGSQKYKIAPEITSISTSFDTTGVDIKMYSDEEFKKEQATPGEGAASVTINNATSILNQGEIKMEQQTALEAANNVTRGTLASNNIAGFAAAGFSVDESLFSGVPDDILPEGQFWEEFSFESTGLNTTAAITNTLMKDSVVTLKFHGNVIGRYVVETGDATGATPPAILESETGEAIGKKLIESMFSDYEGSYLATTGGGGPQTLKIAGGKVYLHGNAPDTTGVEFSIDLDTKVAATGGAKAVGDLAANVVVLKLTADNATTIDIGSATKSAHASTTPGPAAGTAASYTPEYTKMNRTTRAVPPPPPTFQPTYVSNNSVAAFKLTSDGSEKSSAPGSAGTGTLKFDVLVGGSEVFSTETTAAFAASADYNVLMDQLIGEIGNAINESNKPDDTYGVSFDQDSATITVTSGITDDAGEIEIRASLGIGGMAAVSGKNFVLNIDEVAAYGATGGENPIGGERISIPVSGQLVSGDVNEVPGSMKASFGVSDSLMELRGSNVAGLSFNSKTNGATEVSDGVIQFDVIAGNVTTTIKAENITNGAANDFATDVVASAVSQINAQIQGDDLIKDLGLEAVQDNGNLLLRYTQQSKTAVEQVSIVGMSLEFGSVGDTQDVHVGGMSDTQGRSAATLKFTGPGGGGAMPKHSFGSFGLTDTRLSRAGGADASFTPAEFIIDYSNFKAADDVVTVNFGVTAANDAFQQNITLSDELFFSSVAAVNIRTFEATQEAIVAIDEAMDQISSARAELGAIQNRAVHTGNNNGNVQVQVSEANSRILDLDFADESTELAKQQVLQQTSSSMLLQANQNTQLAVRLVGG